jgi:RNA polymerase sigma factor for flagellar operon FliA
MQEGLGHRLEMHHVPELDCLTVYDPPGHLDRIDGLKSLLVGANKVERLVVLGYYWQDQTMKQIGESLGLSESRISQIHTNLIARLRERLEARASA